MRSWLSVCFYGRKVQERKPIYRLLHHYNSLSNKMDKSLLAVRNINHKYIVVGKEEIEPLKNPFIEMEHLTDVKAYQADWSKSYKKARAALYGTPKLPPAHNAAFLLMQQEAEMGNARPRLYA